MIAFILILILLITVIGGATYYFTQTGDEPTLGPSVGPSAGPSVGPSTTEGYMIQDIADY
nr:hypothetical protein OlV1_gene213 [Ostreococcus lucimarinus virus 1]